MKTRLLVVLLTCFATVAHADEAVEAKIEGSYFAMIVSDVEASRNWYQTVLGLEEISRSTERGRYDIINMAGPGLFVELLQLDAAAARPGGQIEGPFKVGMLVDDLTAFAAALPATTAEANIIYDQENSIVLLQLKDLDNNTVQVMQKVED
ncbi:MAG: VOC family protein [Woeseiaceae bacterium]